MKKLFALICLFSFLSTNICFAVEDFDDDSEFTEKARIEKKEKPVKKDPGLIKLPNRKKIDKKLFEAKMQQDEKAYKKVNALSTGADYIFYKDDEGIIKATKDNPENEEDLSETRQSWLEGYYMFYKVADRIIRANNLDTQNWRFSIAKKTEDVNAYATAANLVVINSSLVDSFYDNEDALAWLIGHEMSHHILNHTQQRIRAYELIENWTNEMALTIMVPIPFIVATPCCYAYIRKWYRRLRKLEIEADTEALTLMARAGYDVDYANDVLSTLVQLGERQKSYTDTHPTHKKRIENVNKQIATLDVEALKIEGEKNLYEKPVMAMKRSSDKKTIVLIPEKSRGSVNYSKDTPQRKLIFKAYSAYLKDDMTKSAELFEQAYKTDKKNYIPCLYLSYIYEYNFKLNHDEESLKLAKVWAKRAYKKQSSSKDTIKQKLDVENLKLK